MSDDLSSLAIQRAPTRRPTAGGAAGVARSRHLHLTRDVAGIKP